MVPAAHVEGTVDGQQAELVCGRPAHVTGLTAPAVSQTHAIDGGDNIATATDSELFAFLDEDVGPR